MTSRDDHDCRSESNSPSRLIPPDNRILYFLRDRATFRFLSHFYPSVIRLDNEIWPTVEHYYQAQKSDSAEYKAAIRAARTAGEAKRLAAQPTAPRRISKDSWFRRHGQLPRSDWHEVKLAIMRWADFAKYEQNVDLAQMLLETGDAELIEDSPGEPFWGSGPEGQGLNWAGRVLMEVRQGLRNLPR